MSKVPPYWVYVPKLLTPMCFNNIGKVLMACAGFSSCDGMIEICHGRLRYLVNGGVISLIANNYFDNKVTLVSFCGESYPLEDIDDILGFLRTTKSERFFVDGGVVKAFTNPVKE
jgi:hypothetical protein